MAINGKETIDGRFVIRQRSRARLLVVVGLLLLMATGCNRANQGVEVKTAETVKEETAPVAQNDDNNGDEMRVEKLDPKDDFEIGGDEHFQVWLAEEKVGMVIMTNRFQYGAKPNVVVRNASDEILFDGLWEERFDEYESIAVEAARKHLP